MTRTMLFKTSLVLATALIASCKPYQEDNLKLSAKDVNSNSTNSIVSGQSQTNNNNITPQSFDLSLLYANLASLDGEKDRNISGTSTNSVQETKTASFKYSKTTDIFKQEMFTENWMTAVIKIEALNHTATEDFDKNNYILRENDLEIKDYTVVSADSAEERPLDIVFAIDDTGSMSPIINSVRTRVTNFVRELELRNIKARLCLVTFKDQVGQRCLSFVEDLPTTTANENLNNFISRVSALVASGGAGATENFLGGIQAAANDVPWNKNGQRIIIAFTDQGAFWDSLNKGEAGSSAPNYHNLMSNLIEKGIQVFTVTAPGPGLSTSFRGEPSIAALTHGDWFNLSQILSGLSTFESVFNSIVQQVSKTVTITYNIERNNLDPSLSLAQRLLSIQRIVPLSGETVSIISLSSTMPSGQPIYTRTWNLTSSFPVFPFATEVYINNVLQSSGYDFNADAGLITFNQPPPSEAEIKVVYEPVDLVNNIHLSSIELAPHSVAVQKVTINGVEVGAKFYSVEFSTEGESLIKLNPDVLSEENLLHIRANSGLDVEITFIHLL